MWPDRRLQNLFKIEFPIVLAPMAGVVDADLVIAVAQGGALGSLPCAMLSVEKAREQVNVVRQRVSAPINMNFFCHRAVEADSGQETRWKGRLAPYYAELGLDPAAPVAAANRAPFDAATFELGAAGVQIGSAYLRCPESKVIAAARTALAQARDDATVITNVMTGRPARGVANRVMREVGPISPDAPAFPHAATGLAPLKAAAEKLGKVDFTNLWAGQAVRMGREMPAAELTRALAGAALH